MEKIKSKKILVIGQEQTFLSKLEAEILWNLPGYKFYHATSYIKNDQSLHFHSFDLFIAQIGKETESWLIDLIKGNCIPLLIILNDEKNHEVLRSISLIRKDIKFTQPNMQKIMRKVHWLLEPKNIPIWTRLILEVSALIARSICKFSLKDEKSFTDLIERRFFYI